MMGSKSQTPTKEIDALAKTLAEVLEPLSGKELENATINAIRKHRNLTDRAEDAYNAWSNTDDSSPEKEDLLKAYQNSLMNNRAQIAVVAALTDKLGYIPVVERDTNEQKRGG